MDSPDQTTLPTMRLREPVEAAPTSQPPSRPRRGRFYLLISLLCVAFLLLGLILGVASVLLYASVNAGDRQAAAMSPLPADPAVTVQLSTTYLSQMLQKEVKQIPGVPGEIQNIQVKTDHDGSLLVTGDDHLNIILGLVVTKHATLRLQPYIRDCQMKMHVLHVDLDGLSFPSFYTELENQINQQVQVSSSELPQGFTYCMTGVRTSQSGLVVTYSATPIP